MSDANDMSDVCLSAGITTGSAAVLSRRLAAAAAYMPRVVIPSPEGGSVCERRHRVYVAGRSNENVAPCPGVDATVTLPPWRSTTRFTMLKPIPLPGYLSLLCRR